MDDKAVLLYYDPINDISEVKLGEHHVGFGGPGDSYCYGHQSFDCWDNFTSAERDALFDVDYGSLL